MWQCKHCKQDFKYENNSQRANHSRWCDKNPKRNDWNKNAHSYKRWGKIKSFYVECFSCQKKFDVKEREKLFPQKNKYFCSRSCANSMGGKAKVAKYGISSYVTVAKKYFSEECAVCGENRVLDVHHIDENRNNNSPENLIFLCPNHHALWHRCKDEEVKKIIEGHGTAWGGHLACTEEIS